MSTTKRRIAPAVTDRTRIGCSSVHLRRYAATMVARRNVNAVVGLDGCVDRCESPSTVSLDVLRERLPNRQAYMQTAELFRLLGDPTRVAILHALLAGGELCVCDLAAVVGVGENVVSQAMRLLRATDVVRTRRDGRWIRYRLADSHVRMLLDLSVEHIEHGPANQASATRRRRQDPPNKAEVPLSEGPVRHAR